MQIWSRKDENGEALTDDDLEKSSSDESDNEADKGTESGDESTE